MVNSLLTNDMIARMVIMDMKPRMYGKITPFRCKIEFDFVMLDRTKTVDDFIDWHIHPAVSAALCYAENGVGSELVKPKSVEECGLASHNGIDARVISAYIIGMGQIRHRLDIRYSA